MEDVPSEELVILY